MSRRSRRLNDEILICPDEWVSQLRPVAEQFMRAIFDLEPGEYLITDQSGLADFASDAASMQALVSKVIDTYQIGLIPNNLLQLFRELASRTQH